MHFNFAHSESGASTIAANVKCTNLTTDCTCSHKMYKRIASKYIPSHPSSSNIKWSSTLKRVEVKSFEQHVGPQVVVPCSSVGAFFFFTRTLLEYIVLESNKYALKCMGQEKYDSWEKITVDELTAFLGFMLLMGIVRLPSIADYWKRDEVFHYTPVAREYPTTGFFELQRYLHFANNSTLATPATPGYNRLGKIQPVIDRLLERFQAIHNLHRDVSVDEALVPFKGQSTLKQYMPKKPVRHGFKVWMLADSHTPALKSILEREAKQLKQDLVQVLSRHCASPYNTGTFAT